jgi:hypothetical protein
MVVLHELADAIRSDPSPKRISRFKHDYSMVRTKRSAKAFRFR